MAAALEAASKRQALETRQLYATILSPAALPDERHFVKPQFKLIYELAKSLASETNALRGVFSQNDFAQERKWDRRSREQFVQRLVEFVSGNKRPVVGLVSAKVVAGAEPAKTNELLQSLAKIVAAKCTSASSKTRAAVARPRTVTKQVRATRPVVADDSRIPSATKQLAAADSDEQQQAIESTALSPPSSAKEPSAAREQANQTKVTCDKPIEARADVAANLEGVRSSLKLLACTIESLISLENSLRNKLVADIATIRE